MIQVFFAKYADSDTDENLLPETIEVEDKKQLKVVKEEIKERYKIQDDNIWLYYKEIN